MPRLHAGVPLPQHSLLCGHTWWDKCTWRSPSSNTINDIHDHPEAKQLGGQSRDWTDSHAGPPLNLDWISEQWDIKHHRVCTFSWRPECQMPVWGHQSNLWILLNPICWGAVPPSSLVPRLSPQPTFSEECTLKFDQIFWPLPKLGHNLVLWHFLSSREALQVCRVWMMSTDVFRA